MTKIKICPKCDSKHMKWIKKGDRGYHECDACGYVGVHAIEEEGDDNPEISW